jgi:hypothetical protein
MLLDLGFQRFHVKNLSNKSPPIYDFPLFHEFHSITNYPQVYLRLSEDALLATILYNANYIKELFCNSKW